MKIGSMVTNLVFFFIVPSWSSMLGTKPVLSLSAGIAGGDGEVIGGKAGGYSLRKWPEIGTHLGNYHVP